MRIGIDGKLAGDWRTGMGVMVYNVIREAAKAYPEHQFYVYVPKGAGYDTSSQLAESGAIVRSLRGGGLYPLWEQVTLPIAARLDGLDVFWSPYNTSSILSSVPFVLTVHDAIYMEGKWTDQATLYKRFGKLYRQIVVPRAVVAARSITTVSEYSRSSISAKFPQARDKICTVHLAPDVRSPPLTREQWHQFTRQHAIADRYMLAFSSSEKRKNAMRLLSAYAIVADRHEDPPQLVIFGHRQYGGSQEWQWIKERPHLNVVMLEYISESAKVSLYSNSLLFAFPSLDEGFGLPVLEAYESSTPVVTSSGSALSEIAGNAAIMVDPTSVDDIARGISSVLEDTKLAAEMVERGRRRAGAFSWSATAGAIVDVLTNLRPVL